MVRGNASGSPLLGEARIAATERMIANWRGSGSAKPENLVALDRRGRPQAVASCLLGIAISLAAFPAIGPFPSRNLRFRCGDEQEQH
jgi:cytochrome c biogenesis protein CcdA